MFIESCKFCGEAFTSASAKSTHPSNCLSFTQDDDTVELPKVKENLQSEQKTEKRRLSLMCPFCGQKVEQIHTTVLSVHFKKCEIFNKHIDKKYKTCRLCEVPLKSFVPHFRKFHRDILIGNSTYWPFSRIIEKKKQISKETPSKSRKHFTKTKESFERDNAEEELVLQNEDVHVQKQSKHACVYCAKSFKSLLRKREHISHKRCKVLRQHVDLKLRKCNHCGDIIKKQFIWHFKSKHPDIQFAKEFVIKRGEEFPAKQMMCGFCGGNYAESLINHFRGCSKFPDNVDRKNKKCRKCLKCDHVFRKTEGYMDHFRAMHPEVLIEKKKSAKVAKISLVRLSEELIQKYYSNLDTVNDDKAIEKEDNQNPDDNNDTCEDMDCNSSLNLQITEPKSIEATETMDTELSNECISDTYESSNTEEITTLIDNQVPSMKNFEVPDLDDFDLQIIDVPDVPEKPIEVIEIEDEPDNQSKFFKCPLCTQKFSSEETTMKHLLTYHRFSEQKVKKLGLVISTIH